LLNTLALSLGAAAAVLVMLNGFLPHGAASLSSVAASDAAGEHESAESGSGDTCCPVEAGRDWCGEHDLAENECAVCHPERAATLAPGESLKLRLPSRASAAKAGVATDAPVAMISAATARAVCRVAYNETRLARVTPLVSGVVTEVLVDLGAEVAAGQALARLVSPELADRVRAYREAQAQRDLAASVYQREKGLHEKGISSGQDFQQAAAEQRRAQAAVEAARQELELLGLDDAPNAKTNGASASSVSSIVVLRAPFAGTIIERRAVAGEAVERGAALFTVADLSEMWLDIALPQALMSAARVADVVRARFDGLGDRVVEARIDWVAPFLEEGSRTLKARAVAANPERLLKHGMYGEVSVNNGAAAPAFQLPADAVHHYDGHPFVFVQVAEDLFDVRRVAVGATRGTAFEITAGLAPEERVVTARSHVVKSEFLKSRLGAGCVDD